jgi:hypothetical protein
MLVSTVMLHRGAQLISLLLIVLAFGFCVPDRASAHSSPLPGIVGDEARVTPACDTATDGDPGLPKAKTGLVAVSAGAIPAARVDASAPAAVAPVTLAAPRQIALDVLASRAPPLV